MPFIRRFSFSFLDHITKMVGKLNAPFTNGFVAYFNASKGKLILNIPITMVKAMICPYSLTYYGYGKTADRRAQWLYKSPARLRSCDLLLPAG